jgi:hypothetical protein
MSRIRRRSTKAEARLETLEGRITPAGMSPHSVVGAQLMVWAPNPEAKPTGLTKAEYLALNHYEHIKNAKKAEIFLAHHHRLERWLKQVPYYPASVASSAPTNANNPAPPTTQGNSTAADQTSPDSTIPSSDSGPGQPTTPVGQRVGAAEQMGSMTSLKLPPAIPVPTAALDATLSQIYRLYQDGDIDQAKGQYAGLAIFSGDDVEVEIKGNGGNFQALLDAVNNVDSKISVTSSSSTYQLIIADVPIADLVSLAQGTGQFAQSVTVAPPPYLN